MSIKTVLSLVLIVVAAVFLGCDDDATVISTSNQGDLYPDREAALAAIWLSGELTAPDELYQTLHDDLSAIRNAFADSTTMTSVTFRARWVPSQLLVGLTEDGANKLARGRFFRFYQLGLGFGVTEIDTSSLSWRRQRWLKLNFSGVKNPERLAEAYDVLCEVEYAEPNHYAGDWSCVYPWQLDGAGMSYLFRYGWDDCPAGCIRSVFWYFRVVDDDIEFVGRYDKGFDAIPPWWEEARRAYEYYRYGGN